MRSYDVAIVGGGIVGLTFAYALAKFTPLSVVILESQSNSSPWTENQYSLRVSAITLASQRIFQALKIWDEIKEKRVSPFNSIHVWDELGSGRVEFNACDIAQSHLGYIIENDVMQEILEKNIKNLPNAHYIKAAQLANASEESNSIKLTTLTNEVFQAKLVVGADGGNSWVRQVANINVDKVDYHQVAIVATLTTAMPHLRIARQVFRRAGPLAFLPLKDAHSISIVWSLPLEEAQRLLDLEAPAFCNELENAIGYQSGTIQTVSKRYQFPLYKQEAKRYIKSRIALIGDAAHTMHPLAGQGVNIGLLDAASLFDVIVAAKEAGRDFASLNTLRGYERWRKSDNLTLLTGVHALKQLFTSDKTLIQGGRNLGLALTNKVQVIKNMFIRQAVGKRSNLPKLAQINV